MNRRDFVKKGMVLGTVTPMLPLTFSLSTRGDSDPTEKPSWLVEMIHRNDQVVKSIRKRRVNDQQDPLFGAVLDGVDMATPHAVTGFIKTGICSLASPESEWYGHETLLEELIGSAAFLLKLQHEDGTIDLVITNFHSTPDTGFLVKYLCPVYGLLQNSGIKGKEPLLEHLHKFLQKAGEALLVGGIHTPNHRWVVCAALAGLHMLWPKQEYVDRANDWLAEGIDMDEDGQYEEKSSYIYSSLSDRVLIHTARGFNKPELLDYVRKNLEMTLFYLHPNGEVVTEASGRQDQAIIGTLENYYYPYRYLAIKDKNERFASACRLIESTAMAKTTGFLQYFLEDLFLWEKLPEPGLLPIDYFKDFRNSGLVRIRRGDYDASILPKNAAFFTFHKMNTVLQGVRLASAFFGKGQFVADTYEVIEGKTIMESHLEGPYYQPFPRDEITGDGVWEKMPKTERKQSEIQKLHSKIIVTEIPQGFELDISMEGTDHVPLVIELIFRPGGTFGGLVAHEELDQVFFLKEGMGKYQFKGESIVFGPAQYAHKWVDIRGALPRMEAPTVYLTAFTPFHTKIRIS
jgi:hypothetical protein